MNIDVLIENLKKAKEIDESISILKAHKNQILLLLYDGVKSKAEIVAENNDDTHRKLKKEPPYANWKTVLMCKGCNRMTNSAASNWWNTDTKNHATECYAAWDNGKWVEGCAYDKLDRSDKYSLVHFVDELISRRNYAIPQT